ncbi:MAG: transcriptional regulator [Acidiphilium sp. 21-62-4]|nr:MAG: transcriptional regulator [Acidiphilium sp. 21-62-4]
MASIFHSEYKQFLRQLIAARKAAGFTQEVLAARLEKKQSFISKYERGERRLDVVEFLGIAKAIGIDPIIFIRDFINSSLKEGDA